MGAYLNEVMLNTRRHLGDMNEAAYEVNNERLALACQRVAQRLGSRYGSTDFWLTPAITLSDTGSSDFNFSSGLVSYISEVKLRSTGLLLKRWPRPVIDSLRQSNPVATGKPVAYYETESVLSVNGLSLYPRPVEADFLDVRMSRIPALGDILDPTATFFPWGEHLVAAIEYRSAAQIASSLDQAALDRLHLSPDVIKAWLQEATLCEKEEATRKARLTRVSHIPAQVN